MIKLLLAVIAFLVSPTLSFPVEGPSANVQLAISFGNGTFQNFTVVTGGHDVNPPSGGLHHCDGTNDDVHPTPGPTATSALDNASKINRFTWDGEYVDVFDDYDIISIFDVAATNETAWVLSVNGNVSDVRGCSRQVEDNDVILWELLPINPPTTGTNPSEPLPVKARGLREILSNIEGIVKGQKK